MSNRLISETSPYLLQHAHNPVDWFPWCTGAFEKAKAENKPVLISIGYSACHWCHVMERESFEDAATASLMNAHFVNIKIDREERPDLDHIYMDAVQTMSGSGGWPLNVFLTPDAKPFYGGTYFPPVKAYNRSSWTDVLTAINLAWQEKPHEIVSQAENLTEHLRQSGLLGKQNSQDTGFSGTLLQDAATALMKQADTQWGGFGQAPKFPQTFNIIFLLRQAWYQLQPNDIAGLLPTPELPARQAVQQPWWAHNPLARQALLSLDKMTGGGIYDHLGGGFARYSTDAEWLAPHFEKMLYDNALIVSALCDAWQATGKAIYRETLVQTLQFIQAEWQDADGGFFSAYDADSEGEEGKYYTWSYEEISGVMTNKIDLELFCACFDITPAGNWEHTNIIWLPKPTAEIFRNMGLSAEEGDAILRRCKLLLLEKRTGRIRPLLDDKKLMCWNALMITGCCRAYAALGDDAYLEMAKRAASFVESKLKLPDGGYAHNYKAGKAANPAFIDDLAAYIQALCLLQECTGDTAYLQTAVKIVEIVLADFPVEDSPFFYFTPAWQTDIILRRKDLYDGAQPSGNSLMAGNLLYLGKLLDKNDWVKKASDMVQGMARLIERHPSSFANWAVVCQYFVYGQKEITIAGSQHTSITKSILGIWLPNKILMQAEQENSRYPLLSGKSVEPGETFIYLCENQNCSAPVKTLADFKLLLSKN